MQMTLLMVDAMAITIELFAELRGIDTSYAPDSGNFAARL